ncbi:832_t:CDS:2 [Ambispora gerdemannii]|uniref:832_t:CDS:1 n=1 Tax=Ambispora gerdemannii TaxID=144530 RepID=A0A9N8WI73_9GLOM|nr:832_t:CDS:2 [Ambispora gerdemannii]
MISNTKRDISELITKHKITSPIFPPNTTVDELMANSLAKLRDNGKISKIPNAFMAYRMTLQKQIPRNIFCPTMGELSSIAGILWENEPFIVKNYYRELAHQAKEGFEKYWITMSDKNHISEIVNTNLSSKKSFETIPNVDNESGVKQEPANNISQMDLLEFEQMNTTENSFPINFLDDYPANDYLLDKDGSAILTTNYSSPSTFIANFEVNNINIQNEHIDIDSIFDNSDNKNISTFDTYLYH